MRILISLLALFLLMGVMTPSNTVQPESDATIGGGQTQMMEDINTSPNPLPSQNESDKFRGSTIQKEEEAPIEKEDDAQKVPTYEHNGLYRKGL